MIYSDKERRTHIIELQQYLLAVAQAEGFLPEVIPDGFYGDKTEKAVSVFQNIYGLPVTGETDKDTWDTLILAYKHHFMEHPSSVNIFPKNNTEFEEGNSGYHIYILHMMLDMISKNYSNMPAVNLTDQYNQETSEAVKFVQKLSGYPETGKTDKYTWNMIVRLFEHLKQ